MVRLREFITPQTGVWACRRIFDVISSTAITAFDADGNVIGSVSNTVTGLEFLVW